MRQLLKLNNFLFLSLFAIIGRGLFTGFNFAGALICLGLLSFVFFHDLLAKKSDPQNQRINELEEKIDSLGSKLGLSLMKAKR